MSGLAQVGVVFPEIPLPVDRWREIGDLAREAEDAGADSIWLTDHLLWHRPAVDALAALALVAAATERATIGPCVLQAPLRSTVAIAKAMAFIGALAPGRTVLGVGAGEHPGEYAAAGLADRFARRGALLDEAIEDLRGIWAGAPSASAVDPAAAADASPCGADDSGDSAYSLSPAAPVPIWVGGRSAPARRRAANRGDGWIPHLVRVDDLARDLPLFAEDLAAAGRADAAVTRAAVVAVAVDQPGRPVDRAASLAWLGRLYAMPATAFDRVLVSGHAEAVATELTAMAELGLEHAVLFPVGEGPVDQLAATRAALQG